MAKPSAIEKQLSSFDVDEDDDMSIPELMQKATEAKQSQNNSKSSKKDDLDNITAIKKKREVISLTPSDLLGKNGIDTLRTRLDLFTAKCPERPGSELVDLNRLFQIYQAWAENLGVKEGSNWPDFVEKLDRLKKNDIRKYLVKLRNGETEIANENFVPLPTFTTWKLEAQEEKQPAVSETVTLPFQPPPVVSDEVRRRIEEKKQEALRRREEKLRQIQLPPAFTVQSTTFSQMATQAPLQESPTLDFTPFSQAATQPVDLSIASHTQTHRGDLASATNPVESNENQPQEQPFSNVEASDTKRVKLSADQDTNSFTEFGLASESVV